MNNISQEFIAFSVAAGALSFGEFVTKAGRVSPYFFNAGLFNDGTKLGKLAQFYAQALQASNIEFDMLFGPAYKGISLASSTAVALANLGRNVPFAYNRKEAKNHGEGGATVGAKLAGNVVIIDDVITAGTSINESVKIIRAAGATPVAALIALDRMEKADNDDVFPKLSAVQKAKANYNISVINIANLNDLFEFMSNSHSPELLKYAPAISEYRSKYGAT